MGKPRRRPIAKWPRRSCSTSKISIALTQRSNQWSILLGIHCSFPRCRRSQGHGMCFTRVTPIPRCQDSWRLRGATRRSRDSDYRLGNTGLLRRGRSKARCWPKLSATWTANPILSESQRFGRLAEIGYTKSDTLTHIRRMLADPDPTVRAGRRRCVLVTGARRGGARTRFRTHASFGFT